jgi:predicted phosphodiesterase
MNGKCFSIVSDTHGDEIDPVMETKFFDWLADYKPTIRIHAGDVFDFRALRNGASLEEKQQSMSSDLEAGLSFIKRYFKTGSEKWLLWGNHDDRLFELARAGDGPLQDHAKNILKDINKVLNSLKVKTLPYDSRNGVLQIGHLKVIHGYHVGVGAAKQHATIYGNVMFGHVHSQDCCPVPSLHGPSLAMGIGCLCHIDMPYNKRHTNKLRHQQGWIYGVLFPNGQYSAHQAKRVGDQIVAANSFKIY